MDYIVKERSPFEMLLDAELTDAQMLDKSIFFLGKLSLPIFLNSSLTKLTKKNSNLISYQTNFIRSKMFCSLALNSMLFFTSSCSSH